MTSIRLLLPAFGLAIVAALCCCGPAEAEGGRLARWQALRAASGALAGVDDGAQFDREGRVPPEVRAIRDIAYGADRLQRLDVYMPAGAPPKGPLPVVFFVHGGGWRFGDKGMSRVVEPKVAHWVARGWIVVSANYRLLPAAPVATQLDDVAAALTYAQSHAAQWGADPARFVLMGHSAGAHLVALLAAGVPAAVTPQPWRGAVLLDSAALDVPALMRERHFPLYDHAFGRDPANWEKLSPLQQLARPSAPLMAVCSTRRHDSCPHAEAFVAKDTGLGARAQVLREDLSHGEINMTLGASSDYTARVDAFLDALR